MTTKKSPGLHGFLGGGDPAEKAELMEAAGDSVESKPTKVSNISKPGKSVKEAKSSTVTNTAKQSERAAATKGANTGQPSKGSKPATGEAVRSARTIGNGEAKRTATTDLPPSLHDYAKDAAYWRRETLTDIIEHALRDWLARAEQENGGPFLPRPHKR